MRAIRRINNNKILERFPILRQAKDLSYSETNQAQRRNTYIEVSKFQIAFNKEKVLVTSPNNSKKKANSLKKKISKCLIERSEENKKSKEKTNTPILGTANYMAPEIINGSKNVKGEADYWALGVILYFIYANIKPFDAEEPFEIFDNIQEYNINWDLLENTSIDIGLLEIVKGLLIYNQEDRIQFISTLKKHTYFQDFDWENCLKSASPLKNYANSIIKATNEKVKASMSNMSNNKKDVKNVLVESESKKENEIQDHTFIRTKKKYPGSSNSRKNTEVKKLKRQNSFMKVDNLFQSCSNILSKNLLGKKVELDFDGKNKNLFDL